MIRRNIDVWSHLFAQKNANKIIASCKAAGTKSRFNTDIYKNEYLGYLGESIFSQWLDENNIEYKWQRDRFGESDDYDFLINDKKVDVKTNSRRLPIDNLKDNFQLLLHADQVGVHAHVCFWICVVGQVTIAEVGYLVGCMSSGRAANQPIVQKLDGVSARWINRKDVIPPRDFQTVLEEI